MHQHLWMEKGVQLNITTTSTHNSSSWFPNAADWDTIQARYAILTRKIPGELDQTVDPILIYQASNPLWHTAFEIEEALVANSLNSLTFWSMSMTALFTVPSLYQENWFWVSISPKKWAFVYFNMQLSYKMMANLFCEFYSHCLGHHPWTWLGH